MWLDLWMHRLGNKTNKHTVIQHYNPVCFKPKNNFKQTQNINFSHFNFNHLTRIIVMFRSLLVACDAPLWRWSLIKNEQPILAFDAAWHAVLRHGVNARRVRAFVAAHSLAHVTERRVVVAVGAEGIALKITDTDATILMQIDRESSSEDIQTCKIQAEWKCNSRRFAYTETLPQFRDIIRPITLMRWVIERHYWKMTTGICL